MMSHCCEKNGAPGGRVVLFFFFYVFGIVPVDVLVGYKAAFLRVLYLFALGFGDFGEIAVPCEDEALYKLVCKFLLAFGEHIKHGCDFFCYR